MSTTRLAQISTHRNVHFILKKTHLINMKSSQVSVCLSVQYHKEARDTQDLLKRLDTELNQKYNPEFKDVYQMEGLIREMDVSICLSEHEYISTTDSFYNTEKYVSVCMCRTKPRPLTTLMNGSRLFRTAACKFCLWNTAGKPPRSCCPLRLCVNLTQTRYAVCCRNLIWLIWELLGVFLFI